MGELRKLDRNLFIVYFVAILALLLLPVREPRFHFLGFMSDKWMHVAMFGGLALLLRWNLSSGLRGSIGAICATILIAGLVEVMQGFTGYRDAEWGDVLAGSVGAVLGVLVMNRILASRRPDGSIGILVILLGVMIVAASLLADIIGLGYHARFGVAQLTGAVLGALLIVGGVSVYRKGLISNG